MAAAGGARSPSGLGATSDPSSAGFDSGHGSSPLSKTLSAGTSQDEEAGKGRGADAHHHEAPRVLVIGRSARSIWRSGCKYTMEAKLSGLLIALICCLPVYLQWKTAMEAFSAAEAQGQTFSSNVSLPVIIMETDIYQSEASAGSEPAIMWFGMWYGMGAGLTALGLGYSMWLDLTRWNFVKWWHLALPFALSVGANVAWVWGWFVLHARGWVTREQGFFPGWFALQLLVLPVFPLMLRGVMPVITNFPFRMAAMTALIALVYAFICANVLLPLFNRSSDAFRVVLRLLVLPLLTEFMSMLVRATSRAWLGPGVPAASVGNVMAPTILFSTIVGKYFLTTFNDTAISLTVSLIVAAMEAGLRITSIPRDRAADRMLQVGRGCCCKPSQSAVVNGVESKAKLVDRPPQQLSSHAWYNRMHFATVIVDTVAEDLGALLLVPIVALFRIPSQQGAKPLPLTVVLFRVFFQYVVELASDVGPFFLYALLRRYDGTSGYRAVYHEQLAALSSEEVSSAPDDPQPLQSGAAVAQGPSTELDDASPLTVLPTAARSRSQACCSSLDPGSPESQEAQAEVLRRRGPALAEQQSVLWQRLQWTRVWAVLLQAHPAPSAANRWLAWFVYRLELVSARTAQAWESRQRGWVAMVLMLGIVLAAHAIRTNFGTGAYCPFRDSEGSDQVHFDVCSQP